MQFSSASCSGHPIFPQLIYFLKFLINTTLHLYMASLASLGRQHNLRAQVHGVGIVADGGGERPDACFRSGFLRLQQLADVLGNVNVVVI
jgi:hypothetical protein